MMYASLTWIVVAASLELLFLPATEAATSHFTLVTETTEAVVARDTVAAPDTTLTPTQAQFRALVLYITTHGLRARTRSIAIDPRFLDPFHDNVHLDSTSISSPPADVLKKRRETLEQFSTVSSTDALRDYHECNATGGMRFPSESEQDRKTPERCSQLISVITSATRLDPTCAALEEPLERGDVLYGTGIKSPTMCHLIRATEMTNLSFFVYELVLVNPPHGDWIVARKEMITGFII